jgi:fatty acid desaturase
MASPQKERLIEAHQPHWGSAWSWLGFLAGFFAVEGLLLGALLVGPWWLAVPLVLLVAHLMHAHLIAFHEAAHGTLCPNRWGNDVAGVFIGSLSFMSLTLYRAVHHWHHAFLATERDEELWPFVAPGMPRWARRGVALIELTLGILFTPLLFLRAFLRRESPIQDRAVRRRIWAELALVVLVWGGIMAAVAGWGVWKFFLVMYALPGVVAGNMQSLRKYIEHMGLTGSTVLGATRSVVPAGPVGRLVAMSLFNISYHGVHHQFAKMPYGALPEFTPTLSPTLPEELPPFPSYRHAFRDMLGGLADPRVGPQWREAESGTPGPGKVRVGKAPDQRQGVDEALSPSA